MMSLSRTIKVAVIIPSRGLMFSETAEDILKNLKGIPHRLYFAHKLPIPECFESPTVRAMADKDITHIWMVEDDMIIPAGTLQSMLWLHKPVVTCDYPVSNKGQGAVFYDGSNAVFCGTGCTLIEKAVLTKLGQPYWRSDIRWNIANYGTHIRLIAHPNESFDNYGLHDVNFGMRLQKKHIAITVLEAVLGQRKLLALGQAGSNNGAHQIEEWTKVKKHFLNKLIKSWPVMKSGSLTSVQTPTGMVETSKPHAKRLVENGLGVYPPKTTLIIDWNGTEL